MVVCVDGAAVRSGQKSRPGLLLLACPQWSVCCMCVCVFCVCLCVCVCVGVCSGWGESGHTGWLASSQPAVRVELGIWSLSIGPAGIFQRLLSPPLFNISLLLGILAAEACSCCQHRPMRWYKLRWNITFVGSTSCMFKCQTWCLFSRGLPTVWIVWTWSYGKLMKVLKTELTNCLRRDKMLLCVFSNNTMAEIKNLVKSSLSMTGCAGVRFFYY